jgi:hypothetical protein
VCSENGGKGNTPFSDPVYFHRLTDEYRWVHTVRPAPLYIHRFSVKIDEYKFIFIDFRTDEYNLNIFGGTDEFKNPNK